MKRNAGESSDAASREHSVSGTRQVLSAAVASGVCVCEGRVRDARGHVCRRRERGPQRNGVRATVAREALTRRGEARQAAEERHPQVERTSVCACMCARVRARVCVCVCAHACVRTRVCAVSCTRQTERERESGSRESGRVNARVGASVSVGLPVRHIGVVSEINQPYIENKQGRPTLTDSLNTNMNASRRGQEKERSRR